MSIFKTIKNAIKGLFGGGADNDLAKKQAEQLRMQSEQLKLNAANEANNVAKFDETDMNDTFLGTDNYRKKKTNTGAYSNSLGLQI